jgi:hypothetical protein
MSNTAAVSIPCSAGGRTIITWNVCAVRSGGDNDRSAWRIVRRRQGFADHILPGTPELTMTPSNDLRSWTWIDDSIPSDGTYTYVLQVRRIAGSGTVNEMLLNAYHIRR